MPSLATALRTRANFAAAFVALVCALLVGAVGCSDTSDADDPPVVRRDTGREVNVPRARTNTSDEAIAAYRAAVGGFASGDLRTARQQFQLAFDMGWYAADSDSHVGSDFDPTITFLIGYCAQQLDQFEDADTYYRLTIEQLQGQTTRSGKWRNLWLDAHYNLGMTYVEQHRYRDVWRRNVWDGMDTAFDPHYYNPDDPNLEQGDRRYLVPGAIGMFSTVLGEEPGYMDAYYARGRCYHHTGQHELAREDFEAYLERVDNLKSPYDASLKDDVAYWLRAVEDESRRGSEDRDMSHWFHDGARRPGWREGNNT